MTSLIDDPLPWLICWLVNQGKLLKLHSNAENANGIVVFKRGIRFKFEWLRFEQLMNIIQKIRLVYKLKSEGERRSDENDVGK